MADFYNIEESCTIKNLGNDDYGLIYDDKPAIMEIWHNHDFDGSGCNNLILDFEGKTLDLEFCRSQTI